MRFFEQAAALRPDDYQAPSYLSMTFEALPIIEQHLERLAAWLPLQKLLDSAEPSRRGAADPGIS